MQPGYNSEGLGKVSSTQWHRLWVKKKDNQRHRTCESGDLWRQMIRKILDKDRWERYRRAVRDTDSEDTDSEDNNNKDMIESLEGEQTVAVKKTVSFKRFYSVT